MNNVKENASSDKTVAAGREGKYLTFTLAREEYGIAILKVKEILGMMQITSLPQTPVFVKGVINLRGKVIPIIDLRLKFKMKESDYTKRTCIVVVEIETGSETILSGLIVDSVSEVLNMMADEIENAPSFGAQIDTNFILGIAKMKGGVKILLDIDRALSEEEVIDLKNAP